MAAVTPISVAPKIAPTAPMTSTSVRTAGARSEPPRGRADGSLGRQARDAGCSANPTVPASSTAPAPARAAPVEKIAPAPSASGGPNTHASSTAEASTANARGSSSSVRTHAPTGGVASPIPAARATRTGSATPAGSSATASESAAETDAVTVQDGGLAATVDQPPEQRTTDAERRSRRPR